MSLLVQQCVFKMLDAMVFPLSRMRRALDYGINVSKSFF